MKVKMKHNLFDEASVISELKKDIKRAALTGADQAANTAIIELKNQLVSELKNIQDRASQVGKQTNPTKKPEIPKFRQDIIGYLFKRDYADLEIFKSPNKDNFPTTFGKGFYIISNGRFETAIPLQSGMTAQDAKNMFRESLKDALFVDSKTGQIYIMDHDAFDGIKLKCEYSGRDENQRIENAKKNGETHIIVSAYKKNFGRALSKALPIGTVADFIMEGKFDQAKELLSKFSHLEGIKQAILAVDEIRTGNLQEAPTDFVALSNTIRLIKNIKVEKKIRKNTIDYLLVSTFNEQGKDFDVLFQQLQSQISMWLINTQEKLVQEVIKQVTAAVEKYGRAK